MTYSFIPGDTVEQNSPFHIPGTSAVFRPKATLMCLGDFLSKGLWGIKVRTIRWVCFDPHFFCFNKVVSFPDVWSLGSYSWTQHGFGSVRYRGRYLITVTVKAPLTDTRKPIRTVASPQTLSRIHKPTPKDVCGEAVRTVALTKHSLTLCLQEAFP